MFPAAALLSAIALVPSVWAHGAIKAVSADGVRVVAPNIYYDGDSKNAETVIRKMYRADAQAFVLPGAFADPYQMACEGAGGAPRVLDVNAGSNVVIEWEGSTGELLGFNGKTNSNPWVHATGPVTDYLARCTNNDCATFNAADAGWTKIAQFGLDNSQYISDDLRGRMAAKPEVYYPTSGAGLWGSARLIQQDSTWTVNIPSVLAPGQYILRNEIAALHSPGAAQLYIGCIQLNVKGSGSTQLPAGTNAGALYPVGGEFANYNIYARQTNLQFNDPGPALWDRAGAAAPPPAPVPAPETPPPAPETPAPAPETPAETTPEVPAEQAPPTGNAPACRNRKRSNRAKRIVQHRRRRASTLKH